MAPCPCRGRHSKGRGPRTFHRTISRRQRSPDTAHRRECRTCRPASASRSRRRRPDARPWPIADRRSRRWRPVALLRTSARSMPVVSESPPAPGLSWVSAMMIGLARFSPVPSHGARLHRAKNPAVEIVLMASISATICRRRRRRRPVSFHRRTRWVRNAGTVAGKPGAKDSVGTASLSSAASF